MEDLIIGLAGLAAECALDGVKSLGGKIMKSIKKESVVEGDLTKAKSILQELKKIIDSDVHIVSYKEGWFIFDNFSLKEGFLFNTDNDVYNFSIKLHDTNSFYSFIFSWTDKNKTMYGLSLEESDKKGLKFAAIIPIKKSFLAKTLDVNNQLDVVSQLLCFIFPPHSSELFDKNSLINFYTKLNNECSNDEISLKVEEYHQILNEKANQEKLQKELELKEKEERKSKISIRDCIANCDMDFIKENIEDVKLYKDKYENDSLLLAYLYGQDKIFNYLMRYCRPSFNKFGIGLLQVASVRNDDNFIDKYFTSESMHTPDDWKHINNIIKEKKLSKTFDSTGNFLSGALGNYLGVNETYEDRIEKIKRKEEIESNYEFKIQERKTKFKGKYNKDYFKKLYKESENNIQKINSKIKNIRDNEEKQISTEIEKFFKNKFDEYACELGLVDLKKPKDEFETTASYNERIEKSVLIEKEINEKIDELRKSSTDQINEIRNSISSKNQMHVEQLELTRRESEEFIDFFDNYLFIDLSKKVKFEDVNPISIIDVVSKYDADNQIFDIILKSGSSKEFAFKLPIPIEIAKDFKNNLSTKTVHNSVKRNEDFSVERIFWIEYNNENFYLK